MARPSKYAPELRERAVRMVFEHAHEHPSQWATIRSVAEELGCTTEALRRWVRQAERDGGKRPGLTTSERVQNVWRRAATRLQEADNVFVIGYSWPNADQFFHQLYAVGTAGESILRRFWVLDPNPDGQGAFCNAIARSTGEG